ncbi:lactonase family protein [Amycolatopsis acidicola]|nr:beta-propeller fold lactonase family protein [Amycolatopsis acidicola]
MHPPGPRDHNPTRPGCRKDGALVSTERRPAREIVLVGNFDPRKQPPKPGFTTFMLDNASGKLDRIAEHAQGISVGYTAVDHRRGLVYCTDEADTLPGSYSGGGGQVLGYQVSDDGLELTEVTRSPSFGCLPSGIALNSDATRAVTTHHTNRTPSTHVKQTADGYVLDTVWDDPTTVLFPLDGLGRVGPPLDVFTHRDRPGPLDKQTHPQLHSVTASPSGSFFVVCDKGSDLVETFRVRDDRLEQVARHPSAPGSSPRYSAFHPTLPYFWVNHERRLIVEAFRYDESGGIVSAGVFDTAPDGVSELPGSVQADLRVHPNGKSVYTLLRLVDALTVFTVDDSTGALRIIQEIHLPDRGPRACAISPDGRHLLLATTDPGAVTVWKISDDGRLADTGTRVEVAAAGSVTFAPRR